MNIQGKKSFLKWCNMCMSDSQFLRLQVTGENKLFHFYIYVETVYITIALI